MKEEINMNYISDTFTSGKCSECPMYLSQDLAEKSYAQFGKPLCWEHQADQKDDHDHPTDGESGCTCYDR